MAEPLSITSLLTTAVQEIFPSSCAVHVLPFVLDTDVPLLPLIEVDSIRCAVRKRQHEFAAGRGAARVALAKLGNDPVPIPVGQDRAPTWPAGIVGSLTHTDDKAMAVVARRSDIRAVGIDLEADAAITESLWSHVLTKNEARALCKLATEEKRRHATLIFSAKEALFKLQYPLTSTWLGFEEADITLDLAASSFCAMLSRPIIVDGCPTQTLTGRLRIVPPYVITGVWIPAGSIEHK